LRAKPIARLLSTGGLLLALVAIGACGSSSEANVKAFERGYETGKGFGQPNFLVITSDDQSIASFKRRFMPRTFADIVDPGTLMRQGMATPPRCCPSRAGSLTGEYPHNDGVIWGDYPTLRDPQSTLPVWLQDAGYRTGLIGKYLNGYWTAEGTTPAPGWDRWFELEESPTYRHTKISDQGRKIRLHDGEYLTTRLDQEAHRFIASSTGAGDPFFLWLTPYAPHPRGARHGPCSGFSPVPKPGDLNRFRGQRAPRTPNYDEPDVSDKPPPVGSLPRLTDDERSSIDANWRCSLAAMTEVDRGVGKLVSLLKQRGVLDNTVIAFFSDNGVFHGNHRIRGGKVEPYEEGLRVPFALRMPAQVLGATPQAALDMPVTQLDLTATMMELAGASPCAADDCRAMDGRSLIGPLRGAKPGWTRHRGVMVELRPPGTCGFQAIRTRRYSYIERSDSDPSGDCQIASRELYDLRRDPYQLRNVAQDDPARAANLSDRLRQLAHCNGIEGRDPDPGPSGFCE
jgi:N-acetylglucosamine-6-sulfatase